MHESIYEGIRYVIYAAQDKTYSNYEAHAGFCTKNFFQIRGDSIEECEHKIFSIIDRIKQEK